MRTARPALLLLLAALTFPTAAAAAPPRSDDPAAAAPGEVIVGFRDGATEPQRQRAAERAQASARERVTPLDGRVELLRLRPGRGNADAIDALLADPAVRFAEPNWRVFPIATTSNDPYYTNGSLWGMYGDTTSPSSAYGSQAAEAWLAGSSGSGSVYVGVIDEGIQYTHPDLDANIGVNPGDPTVNGIDDDRNGYKDDVRGWDFAGNNNTIYDGGPSGNADDHGTHVAGTIGAERNGSGVVGVNHSVKLLSGKFLTRYGGTLSNAVRAVDYFTGLKTRASNPVNVVATNNSWGGGGYSQALFDAIGRANAASILFVAAAGNSGTNNDTTASYPSNYNQSNVIAVAAIDRNGALPSWSQYGATTVDLGAPGVSIWSTTAFNTYSNYNGTSMATPHVTGAAALYKAKYPGATDDQVKNALLSSTVPTPSLAGRTVTGGRLDASRALTVLP